MEYVTLITGRKVETNKQEYAFLMKNKDLLMFNSYEDREKIRKEKELREDNAYFKDNI